MMKIKRADVVWVDFGDKAHRGRCKAGIHPAIVVQNDQGNGASPMTIVVPLTDARQFKNLPVQTVITKAEGLPKDSCAEAGHVTTIDRATIDEARGVLATLTKNTMVRVDKALRVSLGLVS